MSNPRYPLPPTVFSYAGFCLRAGDLAAALAFYVGQLEMVGGYIFEQRPRFLTPEGPPNLEPPGVIVLTPAESETPEPLWRVLVYRDSRAAKNKVRETGLVLSVRSPDFEAMEAAGAIVEGGWMRAPWGGGLRSIVDPTGNRIQLWSAGG